jgi:hypothetical protein
VHGACAQFNHDENHKTNGSEHAEAFDRKEVARVERCPMTSKKLLPGALANPLLRWLDSIIRQDTRHC